MAYGPARLRAFLWRFRTLPFARSVFAGVPAPCLLERSLFGFRVWLDVSRSDTHKLLFLEGERFLSEGTLLRRLAPPGARVVDVGANIGYYLLLWESCVGPRGFVHCVEPDPDNLVELGRNVQGNRFDNVPVHAAAAGSRDGTASLRRGINACVDPQGATDLSVPIRRLDSLIVGDVDVLKIDVEGYEGEVLAGAVELLRRCGPALFVEVHPWLLPTNESVAGVLARLEAYRDKQAFEPVQPAHTLGKLTTRYVAGASVRALDWGQASSFGRERTRPFWIVCRT